MLLKYFSCSLYFKQNSSFQTLTYFISHITWKSESFRKSLSVRYPSKIFEWYSISIDFHPIKFFSLSGVISEEDFYSFPYYVLKLNIPFFWNKIFQITISLLEIDLILPEKNWNSLKAMFVEIINTFKVYFCLRDYSVPILFSPHGILFKSQKQKFHTLYWELELLQIFLEWKRHFFVIFQTREFWRLFGK